MLWTRDHLVARTHGGSTIVPACLRCNAAKEDGDPDEFILFARLALAGKKPRVSTDHARAGFRAWTLRSLF
jgi:hypothetical protein